MAEQAVPPEGNSPLAEVSPISLDDLFSRDPLELTDQDIGAIVKELRRQRVNWLQAEASGAKSAKKPKAAGKTQVAPGKSTEDLLKDLGL